MDLTLSRLKEVLDYDELTGIFTWRIALGLNITKPGTTAGSRSRGYVCIALDGTRYRAHRLAWFYMTGAWPADQVDHFDGDRANNRWANLRAASNRFNMENMRKPYRRNKCGLLGVSPNKRKGFDAQIQINGKKIPLGSFPTPELAHAAYLTAKRAGHQGCTI